MQCAFAARSARYKGAPYLANYKDYDVCGDCYFAAEGRNIHEHPLVKIAEVEGELQRA